MQQFDEGLQEGLEGRLHLGKAGNMRARDRSEAKVHIVRKAGSEASRNPEWR